MNVRVYIMWPTYTGKTPRGTINMEYNMSIYYTTLPILSTHADSGWVGGHDWVNRSMPTKSCTCTIYVISISFLLYLTCLHSSAQLERRHIASSKVNT